MLSTMFTGQNQKQSPLGSKANTIEVNSDSDDGTNLTCSFPINQLLLIIHFRRTPNLGQNRERYTRFPLIWLPLAIKASVLVKHLPYRNQIRARLAMGLPQDLPSFHKLPIELQIRVFWNSNTPASDLVGQRISLTLRTNTIGSCGQCYSSRSLISGSRPEAYDDALGPGEGKPSKIPIDREKIPGSRVTRRAYRRLPGPENLHVPRPADDPQINLDRLRAVSQSKQEPGALTVLHLCGH